MGILDILKRLFAGGGHDEPLPPPSQGRDATELARRLGMRTEDLLGFTPAYAPFTLPKRSGGVRLIMAPNPATKELQRRILRRVLARLRAHPAATGFERGQSIATHALGHAGQAVVIRLDLRDFFHAVSSERVRAYFRRIGWNDDAARLLARLCTHDGHLPQGAPTSPRLSNLVNGRLDARLWAMAEHLTKAYGPRTASIRPGNVPAQPGLRVYYTRYADDLTFSLSDDVPGAVHGVLALARRIVCDEGYEVHEDRKLRIMRRHDRQTVTGLVVNEVVQLPRHRRRWLRAVEHRLATGRQATLTPQQLAGWRALERMVDVQTGRDQAPPRA